MVSTFTPNINIEEPARGDDVGVWDTPVNGNMTVLDLVLGGITTIGLNNSNVTLASAQFQCAQITFNSTLTGSVSITFPTSFKKPYTIQNVCTGSSAFTITLTTTAAGGQVIVCPPGQPFDLINDGANVKFKNFGPHIGGYWDYAGSSVPAWVSGCTVPPYLNCDGTTFNPATYPALFTVTNSSILPDLRGRARAYLNQGTGRMTSSLGGVDGNTNFASGGGQTTTLSSLHLPQLASLSHTHGSSVSPGSSPMVDSGGAQFGASGGSFGAGTLTIATALSSVTYGSSSQIAAPVMQPTAIGGLTLIRAA